VEQLSALQDRVDIANRIARLAHAQDAQDWVAISAAFVADAVYVHPGGRLEGVDEIVERTRNALRVLDASQHLVGSITVEVDGDTASSLACFQAQHVRNSTPGGDLYTIAGTYDDRWVRTPDGWRIASRTQTYNWRSGNRDVVAR
jgi:ketosteroid isomerase-like protein